jgi:hypothetical protein
MTEAQQKDSSAAAAATDTAEEDLPFEFGSNPEDEEGTSASAVSENGQATPGQDTPAFNADEVDWLRVDLTTLPEQYRPLTKLAKNLQTGFNKGMEEVKSRMAAADSREQQYLQLIEKLATPSEGETDPFADIRANLRPEQQAAIDMVQKIVKAESGETLTKLQEETGVLKQGVMAIAKFLQNQQGQVLNNEAVSLREVYGDDIDNYADGITALQQIVNPKTGKNYSLTEAYENLSGAIVNKTIAARKRDSEVRNDAASDSLFPPSAESVEGQAPLTEDAVDAALKKLGFD